MTQLSNDVKWNKLQAIQESLWTLNLYNAFYNAYGQPEIRKEIKRNIWLHANKLYDIATEGYKESRKTTNYENTIKSLDNFNKFSLMTLLKDWDSYFIDYQAMISNYLNIISQLGNIGDTRKYKVLECFKQEYEYRNS